MSDKAEWVIGLHAVRALLQINPQRAINLFIDSRRSGEAAREIIALAQKHGMAAQPMDREELSEHCGSDQHQGVAAKVRPLQQGNENSFKQWLQSALLADSAPLVLLLDQVQDPHNFGAILRTADAAGVGAVLVGKNNSCPMTATVYKVASGAAESVALFRVANLARTMLHMKQQGVWIIGTSDQAPTSLYEQQLTGPLALVLGSEGDGMRRLTEQNCDTVCRLPMLGSAVSSLNVSVSAGVALYEIQRQRQSNST